MKKLLTLLYIIAAFSAKADYWTQKADFPGPGRSLPFCFSIGNKGYLGCGHDYISGNFYQDFWEYNPATNVWTQKADYAGGERWIAVGFSIGNKGYAGCGFDNANAGTQDFWEYDPIANTWTQKADFGGGIRISLISFSINNKGYAGTGGGGFGYLNDLWQYDPVSNTWTQKSSLPGVAREASNSFSVGNKGYVVAGYDGSLLNDLWQYDAVADLWTQKTSLPAAALRCDAASFSICDKGFIGTGENPSMLNDLWQYNPLANQWVQKANYGGLARDESAYFTIGLKGYVGLGFENASPFFLDFWEYTPDSINCTTGISSVSATENIPITISPNPFTTTTTLQIPAEYLKENCTITIFDARGKKVFEKAIAKSNLEISRKGLADGIYIYQIISKEKILGSGKIMIQ